LAAVQQICKIVAKLQTIKELTKIFMKKKKVLMIKGN